MQHAILFRNLSVLENTGLNRQVLGIDGMHETVWAENCVCVFQVRPWETLEAVFLVQYLRLGYFGGINQQVDVRYHLSIESCFHETQGGNRRSLLPVANTIGWKE